jgi:hypothetical protein
MNSTRQVERFNTDVRLSRDEPAPIGGYETRKLTPVAKQASGRLDVVQVISKEKRCVRLYLTRIQLDIGGLAPSNCRTIRTTAQHHSVE